MVLLGSVLALSGAKGGLGSSKVEGPEVGALPVVTKDGFTEVP